MTKTMLTVLAVLSVAVAGGVLVGSRGGVAGDDAATAGSVAAVADAAAPLRSDVPGPSGVPRHDSPPSASGNLVVALCDGLTAAEVPGGKEGETPTHEQAQAVVDQLMAEWRAKHPDADWDATPMRVTQANPQAGSPNAAPPA